MGLINLMLIIEIYRQEDLIHEEKRKNEIGTIWSKKKGFIGEKHVHLYIDGIK